MSAELQLPGLQEANITSLPEQQQKVKAKVAEADRKLKAFSRLQPAYARYCALE